MNRKIKNIKFEKATKPRRRMVHNLLMNSIGSTFDIAKREWICVTPIRKEDDGFVHHCELCGARNYEQNILIMNENNNNQLKVGIECASRFLILNGCENQKDSRLLIKHVVAESDLENELITLFKILGNAPNPSIKEVNKFRNNLTEYLTLKGQVRKQYTREEIETILETVLNVPDITNYDIKLLICILEKKDRFTLEQSYRVPL